MAARQGSRGERQGRPDGAKILFAVPFRTLAGTLATADRADPPDPAGLADVTTREVARFSLASLPGAATCVGVAILSGSRSLSGTLLAPRRGGHPAQEPVKHRGGPGRPSVASWSRARWKRSINSPTTRPRVMLG